MDIPLAPSINAVFNAASAVCLVLGLRAKRREDFARHGMWMTAALGLSAAFLVGYVYWHFFAGVPERHYAGPAALKVPYLLMLATHVVLAAVNLPLILWAFWLGKQHRRETHQRVTRFAWPIWMYVSVTGVLVYLVLYVWAPGPPA
jgi:putative membrane protein